MIPYGEKTWDSINKSPNSFESSVNPYGEKTDIAQRYLEFLFESSVNPYGEKTQEKKGRAWAIGLRVVWIHTVKKLDCVAKSIPASLRVAWIHTVKIQHLYQNSMISVLELSEI